MVDLKKRVNSLVSTIESLIYLKVGKSGVEPYTPVDKAVGTIDNAVFMQSAEILHYSFRQLLNIKKREL